MSQKIQSFAGYDRLDDIMEDLTGQTIEESEGDRAGTYFERDKWVCAENIAEALIAAYERGYEDA